LRGIVEICFGSREQPGSGLSFFVADVSIGVGEEAIVVEEVNGLDGLDRFEERNDREAFMAASEGISGVDVAVAGEAESGGISLAGDVSGSLLADLAEGDARVTGGEFVGGVDLGVAGGAEEGGVRAAVEGGGGGFAGVAELGSHG
jgi:hypothetical protein